MSSPHVPSSLSSASPRQALHWRSVDLPAQSQIPDGPSAPFLHRARSSLPVRCALRAPSGLSREAWPRLRRAFPWLAAFVQRPAFSSFLVILPAVAPARLQLAPANSLSVNW